MASYQTKPNRQGDEEVARSLLDQLLDDSRLYKKSVDYLELLEFVNRLRNFAPFNAMLLHIQKPGIRYAASAQDWRQRFDRRPKENARPLLVLQTFGPVGLVYEAQDTQGTQLPEDVDSFFARGALAAGDIPRFRSMMEKKRIECALFDGGDARAGSIRGLDVEPRAYRMQLNRNHSLPVQFATIAHELAHLYLGHLGQDPELQIPARCRPAHEQEELEAESVSYLVCRLRLPNGINHRRKRIVWSCFDLLRDGLRTQFHRPRGKKRLSQRRDTLRRLLRRRRTT